jgi:hypothetical protein
VPYADPQRQLEYVKEWRRQRRQAPRSEDLARLSDQAARVGEMLQQARTAQAKALCIDHLHRLLVAVVEHLNRKEVSRGN